MQHPTFSTIHLTSCFLALLVYFTNQFEQWLIHLCQIRHLRGPVVHLKIDVRGIFRVPRWEHLVVPDTLQIGRIHIVWLRRRDKQIASKLEISCHEIVVCDIAKLLDAFSHGHVGKGVLAQVELHTIIVLVIRFLVQVFQRFIAQRHGFVQTLFRLHFLVASNVLVVLHVGANGQVDGCFVSSHHADVTIRTTLFTTFRLYCHTPHKAHFAFQTFMLAGNSQERSLVAIHIDKWILVWCRHIGSKRNLAFLAGRQVDSNNVVATQRGDDLTFILHTIHAIANYAFGII